MRSPIELFNAFPTIRCNAFTLRPLKRSDFGELKAIFDDAYTKKYYHVLPEHRNNLELLFSKFLEDFTNKNQLTWVITPSVNVEKPIGFLTAELEEANYVLYAKITYALNTAYRGKGIVTEAVGEVSTLLKDCQIAYLVAYIELENKQSVRVIEKNGFTTNTTTAFFDPNVEDGAMRFKWKKDIVGEREYLFMVGAHYFQSKDYDTAIDVFQYAIEADYKEGSPYTDLQFYSNIGMALSSSKRYSDAYKILLYVQENGLDNPSITKELNWLRTNVSHLL